jgi:hypothetical protein
LSHDTIVTTITGISQIETVCATPYLHRYGRSSAVHSFSSYSFTLQMVQY